MEKGGKESEREDIKENFWEKIKESENRVR